VVRCITVLFLDCQLSLTSPDKKIARIQIGIDPVQIGTFLTTIAPNLHYSVFLLFDSLEDCYEDYIFQHFSGTHLIPAIIPRLCQFIARVQSVI